MLNMPEGVCNLNQREMLRLQGAEKNFYNSLSSRATLRKVGEGSRRAELLGGEWGETNKRPMLIRKNECLLVFLAF